jgi:hypothetical protein
VQDTTAAHLKFVPPAVPGFIGAYKGVAAGTGAAKAAGGGSVAQAAAAGVSGTIGTLKGYGQGVARPVGVIVSKLPPSVAKPLKVPGAFAAGVAATLIGARYAPGVVARSVAGNALDAGGAAVAHGATALVPGGDSRRGSDAGPSAERGVRSSANADSKPRSTTRGGKARRVRQPKAASDGRKQRKRATVRSTRGKRRQPVQQGAVDARTRNRGRSDGGRVAAGRSRSGNRGRSSQSQEVQAQRIFSLARYIEAQGWDITLSPKSR